MLLLKLKKHILILCRNDDFLIAKVHNKVHYIIWFRRREPCFSVLRSFKATETFSNHNLIRLIFI